jgi:uncharacterized protein (DUF488 family)
MEKPIIRTIGHSTHPVGVLIDMLKAHGVNGLIDVRTIPKSRKNPQYNGEALEEQLHRQGLGYEHMKALGGLRRPRKDSRNMGWRNESFRGYADYMQTPEFAIALEALLAAADGGTVAIMCAEAVPWRCHRSLIADVLTAHSYRVEHIMSATKSNRHTLKSFARLEGTSVFYPTQTNNHSLT